ncbi:MAG: hypothetical protein OEL76_13585 [Siculibacillus sp.]|nr:hypothetical protein [Siculibacillus sp.]
MIVWAITGLVVGWFLSGRLRVDSLGVFLVFSVAVPFAVFAVLHSFVPDVLWGYVAFWVAVQSAYLFFNFFSERTRPAGEPDEGRSLENA